MKADKPIRKRLGHCPEESKGWDTTENLYIEGDNLEVLELLQEAYLGKVKMMYIDIKTTEIKIRVNGSVLGDIIFGTSIMCSMPNSE